jgi:SAM-dependent methyltransferase
MDEPMGDEPMGTSHQSPYAGTNLRRRLLSLMGSQLGNPRGLLGALIGRTVFAKGNASVNVWVVRQLDVSPGSHVLEIGCGPGLAVHAIAVRHPESHIVGIDRSPAMLHQAQRRNAAFIQEGRVEIRLADAEALPCDDATFDIAVAVHVLYFWPDPVKTLREVHRVLRPGGSVILGYAVEHDAPQSTRAAFAQTGARLYPSAEAVEALVEAAGFTNIHSERQTSNGVVVGSYTQGQR